MRHDHGLDGFQCRIFHAGLITVLDDRNQQANPAVDLFQRQRALVLAKFDGVFAGPVFEIDCRIFGTFAKRTQNAGHARNAGRRSSN